MTIVRPDSTRTVEDDIAAILRGDVAVRCDPSAFVDAAVRQGAAPLLVQAGVARLLPAAESARLRDEARRLAAIAEVRERELQRVLAGFHRDGLDVLLVKGAHLANTCYPASYLRPRDDTDMLVREGDSVRVRSTLARLGYAPQPVQTGPEVLGQTLFDRPGGVSAVLDVHWRALRPQRAAAIFQLEDLMSRAVPVPRLGPHARGPSPADALALACVHQAAHHAGHDVLLWTYDVHLLLNDLPPPGADAFLRFVIGRGIATVSIPALERAASLFGHPSAFGILDHLRAAARDEAPPIEPRSRIADVRLDLRAVRGGRAKARLLAAHLFPPAAYMRATYAPASRAPLSWLYLKRAVRALART